MRSDFYERRTARLARLRELVTKREAESEAAFSASRSISEHIPFGQPILVGHHSEGRHRRDLARIDSLMRKSVEADKAARHHAASAAALESNRSISSDDPEAVTRLRSKIEQLEAYQKAMVAINRIVRKYKADKAAGIAALLAGEFQLSPEYAAQLFEPDFCGRTGFADYQLANNSGNLARCRKRLAQLEQLSTATDEEVEFGDIRVINSATDNRTQIFFPGKPPEPVRSHLKSLGFKWAPTVGAWQRHRSNYAWHAAKEYVASLATQEQATPA